MTQIPYFGIGSATRVFMTVLLFTPAMGLWDTMHPFTKGSMKMKEITDLAETWNDDYFIADTGQFLTLPLSAAFVISLGVLVLHLTASSLLIGGHTRTGRAGTLMRGIYTIVCVPLFIDWEEVFWSSYDSEGGPQFNTADDGETGIVARWL